MSRKSEKFAETFRYECKGYDISGGYSTMKAPKEGLKILMTINRCMYYPDCSCQNYRDAVDQMESME